MYSTAEMYTDLGDRPTKIEILSPVALHRDEYKSKPKHVGVVLETWTSEVCWNLTYSFDTIWMIC
jgi:hypothetical protein